MKICWITLHVKNMEESLKFYTGILGLKIVQRFNPDNDTEITFLGEEDEVQIELICGGKPLESEGVSVGFRVKSLADALEWMKENDVTIKAGPVSPNPSTSFFFVQDPNGFTIQIVEQK